MSCTLETLKRLKATSLLPGKLLILISNEPSVFSSLAILSNLEESGEYQNLLRLVRSVQEFKQTKGEIL